MPHSVAGEEGLVVIPLEQTQNPVHSSGLDGLQENENVQLPPPGQEPPQEGKDSVHVSVIWARSALAVTDV